MGTDNETSNKHLSGVALLLVATLLSFFYLFVPLLGLPQIGSTIIGLIGLIQVTGEALKKHPEEHWILVSGVFIVMFLVAGAANSGM